MALQSAGSSNYIHFGNNAPVGAASDFSVLVTAYIDTSANDAALVCKRNGFSAGTNLFQFSLGGTRRPAITKDGVFNVWNTPQVAEGTWVVMALIGTASGAKSFVDGTQASGSFSSSRPSSGNWQTGSATSANLELFTVGGAGTLIGRISKAAVYDRALSDDEAISASKGLPWPLRGRRFTADLTRTGRDLTNGWTATTVGSLTVQPNPRQYGLI